MCTRASAAAPVSLMFPTPVDDLRPPSLAQSWFTAPPCVVVWLRLVRELRKVAYEPGKGRSRNHQSWACRILRVPHRDSLRQVCDLYAAGIPSAPAALSPGQSAQFRGTHVLLSSVSRPTARLEINSADSCSLRAVSDRLRRTDLYLSISGRSSRNKLETKLSRNTTDGCPDRDTNMNDPSIPA